MFQNAEFWKATWNTIFFCILTVPVGIILALFIADDGNGDDGGLGVGDPLDFLPENLVEDAVLAVEDPAPDHGHGGGGADQGQEEDGAEAALELHLRVEENGDEQGQDDAHGHRQDTE